MIKEVKRTSKKALSLLLAVVMVMTSMSVCFGTFSFTAGAAWEAYDGNATLKLSTLLEGSVIQGITSTYDIGNDDSATSGDKRYKKTKINVGTYADYLEVKEAVIYLHKAIIESENYKNITLSSDAGNCVTMTAIKAEIIPAIETKKGGTLSAGAKEFINYVLDDTHAVKHSDQSTSKVNGTYTNTLTITVDDYRGYLETIEGDYTTVGAYDTQLVYSLAMTGKNGSTNLQYTYKYTNDKGCEKDGTAYHHYFWNNTTNDPGKTPPTATTSTSAKDTLANYVSEVENWIATYNFNKMAMMGTTDIDTLKSTLDTKTSNIKAYIADNGEGKQDEMYDQFFPGITDKINAWKKTTDDAKNIAIYSGDAKALAEYMNSVNYGTFNWGAFDEATIRADYATFTTTYQNLLNNATVYTYFVEQGVINDAALKNFRDNVVVYDLEDTKEAADALYAKYKDGGAINPDLDGEEENPIKPEVDAGLLTGYINSYNGYTAQVKNAIFPDGIEYLLKLQEEFECTVSDCIVYFAEHAYLDYTDTKTDAVIAEIETAKNQLAALEALRATVDYSENLDLLAPVFELAEEFIDYLYTLLADRFALQVTNADAAYTEIGRPTANLTLEQFSKVNGAMSAVEDKILTFLDDEGKGSKITAETRALFAALETNFEPAYNSFKQDRAFDLFEPSSILIRREDNKLEYFRENTDLDNDGVGEYEVTEENVMEIINLLEGALKDPTVAKLLGDLINKDEDGNPTGEAFDLANLINGLLEKIYTDDLLNTIISFLYPIIGKAFADVWATLPPDFTTVVPDAALGMDANVYAQLSLDDVDTAVGNVGIAISPLKLAEKMTSNATYRTKYKNVIDDLYGITTKTHYDADGNYVDPWKDARLYTDKIDENGEVVIDKETGKAKQVYKLAWGITDRASFIDAACAALSGLEPLLYALLLNQPFVNANTTGDSRVRGCKIGTNGNVSTAAITLLGYDLELELDLDPITLYFTVSGNDGYSNVLAPIFEVLGLQNIPKSSDLKNTKDFLEKGLFAMIDQLIAKVAANPIETILGLVPNLVYALEADLVAPLLDLLEIEIYYEADAAYCAYVPDWIVSLSMGKLEPTVVGAVQGAMKAEKEVDGTKVPDPIKINVGQMIDLKSMGVNLSGGLKGILDLVGIELPNLDTAFLAKAGELTWKSSNRTRYTYTYKPAGATTMQAAYIEANKADVLVYLVKWALSNLGELLATFGVDTSSMGDLVTTIFDNLAANSHDAVAAIVELLNQEEYDAKEYNWFDGDVDGESVVGNSAYEIYLNPNNDWTKEKAEYLYNNLDALLTAALTMAGVELDLGATISGAIDGLLTDKTLTALAALLAKLDLNALLAKKDAATEGEEATPDANEPETVAEGEEAEGEEAEGEEAEALDVNALVKQFLDLDLAAIAAEYADIAAAKEADPEYVYDFGVDAGEKTFAAVLAEMLEPLDKVLAFILDGGNLEITIGEEKATLLGAAGYNNAIIPLLEALGCTIPEEGTSLEKTINALLNRIDALTTGDVIKNIIDLLPGVFYFITSNGLATAVMNLLQPVLVIVDTIRPVFDVMALINDLKIGDKTLAELLGGDINLKKLDLAFIFDLLPALVPAIADLDLTGLKSVIYDICNEVGTEYTSAAAVANTANGKAMKGAYTEDFDQADLLTVVLSFILEWATVKENAEALDEMLGTNGIIAGLNKVFEDVEITYGTPDWMYWFEGDEAGYDEYIKENNVPNTLASIDWKNIGDNDWDIETAAYFAENIEVLVDTIIAMIEINGTKYEKLSDLVADLTSGLVTADTVNDLVGMITGLLGDIDNNLIDAAGLLLGVDLVGLKAYTCTAEINSISDFINELAVVLDTYAGGLVNFLFFGDDYRFAKKSDSTDTIVINGGLGYEKGLALILEALGCELPEEATTITVLGALATRVEAILADPVNEVLDLLPNLIYFLNANGLSVAVTNLLQPVYALLDKLAVFGLNVNIADLLKFNVNGKEIAIDLANLSLANVVEVVEKATDLPLDAAESILVGFATGKITKGEYIYKMTAARADVITILLVVVLELVSDDAFAAKLDEMLGTNGIVAKIKNLFTDVEIEYGTPEWGYWFESEDAFNAYLESGVGLPDTLASIDWDNIGDNDWDLETAAYFAENIDELVDTIIAMIEINGTKYEKLSDLTNDLTSGLVTADTVNDIVGMITGLLGDIDDNLIKAAGYLLGVDLVGLKEAYTCTAEIISISDFIREIAVVLDTYAGGLVNFLFFGDDYRFVKKADGNDAIVINGGLGYEKGLALILEALGCDLPEEATTITVLGALADRVDEILANPVNEVLDLLPNLIYFLNANGFGVAVDNLLQPVYVLLDKLSKFGLNVNIADLLKFNVNGKEIAIDPAELSLANVVEVVETLTGLTLDAAEAILVDFATGKITKGEYIYKMTAAREDVITIILAVALELIYDDKFAAELDEMLGTDGIVAGLKSVFAPSNIEYSDVNWQQIGDDDKPVDYLNAIYGTDWDRETAEYLAANLPMLVDTVVGMIEINGTKYESLADLLKANVNVFTTKTLNSLLDLIKNLLGDIDAELLEVGCVLDVDLAGLMKHEVPANITTVDAFAAELATILTTYAKGVVEWLLLGRDFKLLVKDNDGIGAELEGTPYITISGANGYSEGLALLLEALGCTNLPTTGTTEEIVAGVLDSLAARINEIFANPVEEVLALLPNVIYFLNSNGVAAVIDNTIAAVTALLAKLEGLGVKLDINELVNLPKLMGIEDKGASISLDNLTVEAIIEAVGYMLDLDLSRLDEVLNPFAIGKVAKYDSISSQTAYKMIAETDADKADMITVILGAALRVVFENEANTAKLGEMLGTDILSAIKTVFEDVDIVYSDVDWQKIGDDNKPVDYLNAIYGTDWDRETAEYLAANLPMLVDTVVGMIEINGVKYESLAALLQANVNIFTTETLNSLVGLLKGLVPDMYKELLGVGVILDVNIKDLMDYTAPEGIDTLDAFAEELANILNKYAKGLVEWLLLGEDFTFFVEEDAQGDLGTMITINGANGYSEGLALLLEALGVAAPAVVYTEGKLDTEATLKAVFAAIAARINAIFANPVEEVLALLPNVIYFLNSNGVATVIDNTIAAVTALLNKLTVFGVELDINALVNLPKLMGIEDKNASISLDNLTVEAIIEAVGYMLDLDLSRLKEVLNPFAIGSVAEYDSISSKPAYKMTAANNADKADMITVILGAALRVVFENEANTDKIEEMLGTDILSAIKTVFEDVEITYTAPKWDYITTGNDYELAYPTNWTEDTAKYVAAMLPEIADLVAGIIDNNYTSIEALLKDKVNVFTADTLNSIVGLLKNIIPDMYKELLGVGVILDVNINGLLAYECDKEFATVNDFAKELANILSTYIPGVIEWLLLGKDFTFFVEADAQGDLGTMITINGANGYSEGLALLLEALGCQNLPEVEGNTTEAIVAGVLDSVAELINSIFADPVTAVLGLLPNIFYFLNTNGVAAVVDNTIAAVTALLDKLAVFGVELDINELVNLPKLMGIEGKGAKISLDNLSMAAILEAVGLMTGLKLGKLEDLLVGYDLGKLVEYDSVSTSVGATFKMTYGDEYKVYDMITVIANAALIVFTHKDNAEVVKGLIGEDIYAVILNFLATAEIKMQDMSWIYTDKVGTVFSAMERSEEYAGFTYGQLYTETHAEYIADNFPVFVDNVIELLGLEAGKTLEEVLNNLIDGSIYKSDLVITVRDALAGVLDGITKLEVGGVVVGGYIAEVLKTAGIADLNAVAKVEVPEFTADKEQFVASLCDVLEPLYPILKYVLANKDITFFVADNGTDALVTLTGAEGYVYGIIPLLEALGCEGILAPEAYYAAIDANADTLITSIINPLLNKVDKILAAPADEILALLPNLVYFINSNGIDTVVKNTLNAVYAVLAKIQPIAAIDLYELIGIDLATIDFEWILDKVLELLAGMGYEFDVEEIDYVSELTVGKLEKYTSLNGKEAYRMVYTPDDATSGDKAEMVTTIERLVITFITDEKNQAMVVDFLQDNLGMGEAGTKFIEGTIDVLADCAVNTSIGMELALMSTYYVFYGVDTGVQGTVDGMGKLDDAFNGLMDLIEDVNPDSYDLLNKIFGKIDPDGDVFNPGNDGEDDGEAEEGGIAQNGFIKFFQKIATWFQNIGTWFKNLFSFNFLKK